MTKRESHITYKGSPLCECPRPVREAGLGICGYPSIAEAERAVARYSRLLYEHETGRACRDLRRHHALRVVPEPCPSSAS